MNVRFAARQLPQDLVLLVAATLPLGAYNLIPGTALSLGYLATTMLVLVAGVTAYRDRRCRPPFEYWWPAVPMLALALGSPATAAQQALGMMALFLAVVIIVQRRRRAVDGLWVVAMACGSGALLNTLAQAGWIPPAAIDGETQRAVAIAPSVEPAVGILLDGGLAALFCLFHAHQRPGRRAAAGVALLVSTAWCLSLAPDIAVYLDRWSPPAVHQWSPENIALLALTLWLVARVLARSIHQRNRNQARGLAALIAIGTIFHVLAAMPPGATTVLLLGLVAAHDAPWAGKSDSRLPRWLPWPAAACVLIPVLGLVPPAPNDPRNQLARGDALLLDGDYGKLEQAMDFLLERHPGDPAYTLLRAESLLARGWPHAAGDQFGSTRPATDPASRQRFHQQAFLDRLRDTASAHSGAERGFLFERALVHAGDVDSAIDSLVFRRPSSPPAYDGAHAPLADALAFLLGDPGLADRFEDWTAPALHALLSETGVTILPLPTGEVATTQTMVFRAARRPEGLQVDIYGPAAATGSHFFPESPRANPPDQPLEWRPDLSAADGKWSLTLAAGPADIAVVQVSQDGHATIQRTKSALPAGESIAAAIAVP